LTSTDLAPECRTMLCSASLKMSAHPVHAAPRLQKIRDVLAGRPFCLR
jgi:hypothetical protein